MKMLLLVAVLASAALVACTGSNNSAEETSSPTPVGEAAQLTSPTPADALACPSPTPCPECVQPTACPECPTCPEPVLCPAPAQCTPCPSAPDSLAEDCAAIKAGIEAGQVFVDIAQKRGLIGITESKARADLEKSENTFDQMCQGVVLAKPSLLTLQCALAAKWKGSLEEENLHAPDPQNTVWINQFDSIVHKYCMAGY